MPRGCCFSRFYIAVTQNLKGDGARLVNQCQESISQVHINNKAEAETITSKVKCESAANVIRSFPQNVGQCRGRPGGEHSGEVLPARHMWGGTEPLKVEEHGLAWIRWTEIVIAGL